MNENIISDYFPMLDSLKADFYTDEALEKINSKFIEKYKDEDYFSEVMGILISYDDPNFLVSVVQSSLMGLLDLKTVYEAYKGKSNLAESINSGITSSIEKLGEFILSLRIKDAESSMVLSESIPLIIEQMKSWDGYLDITDAGETPSTSSIKTLMVKPTSKKGFLDINKARSRYWELVKFLEIDGDEIGYSNKDIKDYSDKLLDYKYVESINMYVGGSDLILYGTRSSLFNSAFDRVLEMFSNKRYVSPSRDDIYQSVRLLVAMMTDIALMEMVEDTSDISDMISNIVKGEMEALTQGQSKKLSERVHMLSENTRFSLDFPSIALILHYFTYPALDESFSPSEKIKDTVKIYRDDMKKLLKLINDITELMIASGEFEVVL